MRIALIQKITDYVIKEVQNNSFLNGFQYIVTYQKIENEFNIKADNSLKNKVIELLNTREEVADVQEDVNGFDVVLYTDYSPNYNKNDFI